MPVLNKWKCQNSDIRIFEYLSIRTISGIRIVLITGVEYSTQRQLMTLYNVCGLCRLVVIIGLSSQRRQSCCCSRSAGCRSVSTSQSCPCCRGLISSTWRSSTLKFTESFTYLSCWTLSSTRSYTQHACVRFDEVCWNVTYKLTRVWIQL